MKAQHRKELQTNTLADSLGRLIQGLKSGSNNFLYLVCLFVLAAAALFFGVRYFYQKSEQKTARLWSKLAAATKTDLEEIAKQNPGTMQSRIARLEQARTLLREGEQKSYSAFERTQGRKDLEAARNLYGPLAKEFRDMPILAQESLLALAKISENLGDYDKAWEHYRELALQFPDTTPGKEARAILGDNLENKSPQWLDRIGLQQQFNQLADARQKKVPSAPPSNEDNRSRPPDSIDKNLLDDAPPGVSAPK